MKPLSSDEVKSRFWAKVSLSPHGCWEWTGALLHHGYGGFHFNGNIRRAHRLSWEMHHGPIPPGMLVCHKCDNPKCVRPDHLFVGTVKDNAQDMLAKGRGNKVKGEQKDNAKLTASKVADIRALRGILSVRQLAAKHGVSVRTIHDAQTGKSWAHVDSHGGGRDEIF